MGFIAGIVDFKKSSDVLDRVELLKRATAHRLNKLEIAKINNGFVASQQGLSYFPNQKSWLAIDGYLDSLLSDLDTPDAESVLTYTQFTGEYALCYCDGKEEKIFLRRHLLGTQPLYYYYRDDVFVWGTEIKTVLALIGTTPEISEVSETYIKDVQSLEPGCVLKVGPSSIKKCMTEQFQISNRSRKMAFADACFEFSYHFENSVRNKCRSGRPAVLLNGSLDASALHSVVTNMKDQLGHSPVRIFSGDLNVHPRDEVEQMWVTETPFLYSDWEGTIEALHSAKKSGCEVLLTETWGDEFIFAKQNRLMELILSLQSNIQQKRIMREIQSSKHRMTNEWISKAAAYCQLRIGMPFLDRNLIQFLLDIPTDLVNHANVPRNIIKESIGKNIPPSVVENLDTSPTAHQDLDLWKNIMSVGFFKRLSEVSTERVKIQVALPKAPMAEPFVQPIKTHVLERWVSG